MITGKSEKSTQGVKNKAILADSVEAVIAAIYLDSNLENAEKFIISNLKDSIEVESKHVGVKDYKTVLQEKLQEHGNVKIEYEIISEKGPDHDKYFVAQVLCNDKILAKGSGRSKKNAEMRGRKSSTRKYEIKDVEIRMNKNYRETFIGSLTNKSKSEYEEFLKDANKDIVDRRFNKLKVAIAPRLIDKELLKIFKDYNVAVVEIEAQSTNDYILKKCGYTHTLEDIKKATKMLKWRGFTVSFQVGVGLPDSTKIDELNTAKELAKLKPHRVRIYPMVVVKNTVLEEAFKNGRYEPLTLNQAIERCKDVIYQFNKKKIKEISIVKQNELNKSEETEIIAGPYHEEFGQLVTDSIWYDSIVDKIKQFNVKVRKVKIEVNPKELPNIVGYEEENANKLKEFYDVEIKAEANPDIKIGKSKISVVEVYSN